MFNDDDFLVDDFGYNADQEEIPIDSEAEERARIELREILKKDKRKQREDKKNSKVKKLKPNYDLDLEDKDLCDEVSGITSHKLPTHDSCVHEVALPPGMAFVPLTAVENHPKKYSFELDHFQKQATVCIANNQSVLVSAHTSAGKTVVAEYAIALALKNNQRVIYTTPIKALSNQKFRDFSLEFEDVGLMTGDTTINESASCLVMTTEILREMLYEGADITREVGWVIFDEIHYMRDKERGYVWEESIILISKSVKLVFLSATIPNARQFAKWVCFIQDQPCHVVFTETRPTPLEHFLFPSGGDEIIRVVDKQGNFQENNFNNASTLVQQLSQINDKVKTKANAKSNANSDCYKLVYAIKANNLQPAIIFSFSKLNCEFYAKQVLKLKLTDKREEQLAKEVIDNALELLSAENRKLDCINSYIPYLRRGIGIHHGGLMPIVKELTELLFGEGLVKILFATETFAMGLNMPARTVVFTSLQKFDGKMRRPITPGEYIQMSGRAGRRGKDDKGTVIMRLEDNISRVVIKDLLKGKADPINSAFHLTYNMVLNMSRFHGNNPEYILKRSFFQFQNYAKLPDILKEIKERTATLESIKLNNMKGIDSYYTQSEKLKTLYVERHECMIQSPNFINIVKSSGRIIKVIHNGVNFGWCAVVQRHGYNRLRSRTSEFDKKTLVVLMKVSEKSARNTSKNELPDVNSLLPPITVTTGHPVVATVPHCSVWEIARHRISVPQGNLMYSLLNRKDTFRKIDEFVAANFKNKKFLVHPAEHLSLKGEEFSNILTDIGNTKRALENSTVHTAANRGELMEKAKLRAESQREIDCLFEQLDEGKGIAQMSQLKHHKRVLRRLGFITETDDLTTKGRVACDLSAGNELLLVEMLLNGEFGDLDSAECCALLSVFVCTEKPSPTDQPKIKPNVASALNQLQDTALRIGNVLWMCRLSDDVESFVAQFQSSLVEVVYYWCCGRSFQHVCKKTRIFPGNIIRTMKRLEVVLRQMVNVTKSLDMTDLSKKFEGGLDLLKRDIIGMDSLYL